MIPFQTQIIAAVGVAICAGLAGWTVRGWQEDAARLDAERDAHANYIRIAATYGEALDAANDQRATDHQQAAADRQEFDRRMKHATRKWKPALAVCGDGLDAGRLDSTGLRVRFGNDFVGLWDDALAIGLPTPYRTTRPDRPGAGADLLDPEDLLANVATNGEQCNELRSRLLAVQAWWGRVEKAD